MSRSHVQISEVLKAISVYFLYPTSVTSDLYFQKYLLSSWILEKNEFANNKHNKTVTYVSVTERKHSAKCTISLEKEKDADKMETFFIFEL